MYSHQFVRVVLPVIFGGPFFARRIRNKPTLPGFDSNKEWIGLSEIKQTLKAETGRELKALGEEPVPANLLAKPAAFVSYEYRL